MSGAVGLTASNCSPVATMLERNTLLAALLPRVWARLERARPRRVSRAAVARAMASRRTVLPPMPSLVALRDESPLSKTPPHDTAVALLHVGETSLAAAAHLDQAKNTLCVKSTACLRLERASCASRRFDCRSMRSTAALSFRCSLALSTGGCAEACWRRAAPSLSSVPARHRSCIEDSRPRPPAVSLA